MCSEEGDSGYSFEGGEIGETTEAPDANEELMEADASSGDEELLEAEPSEEEPSETEADESVETDSETEYNNEANEQTRTEIEEKSDYSAEVNDHISSVEELEVYQKAELKEQTVDGRTCLVREDIDPDYLDEESGLTNRELMERGRAPFDAKTGERIELHHIGQNYDSPLAELTADSEHGGENFGKLHTSESDSWRNDSKLNNHYNNVQRPSHWKARA